MTFYHHQVMWLDMILICKAWWQRVLDLQLIDKDCLTYPHRKILNDEVNGNNHHNSRGGVRAPGQLTHRPGPLALATEVVLSGNPQSNPSSPTSH